MSDTCPLCGSEPTPVVHSMLVPELSKDSKCSGCPLPISLWPAVRELKARCERGDECITNHEQRWVRLMELLGHDMSDNDISDSEEVIREAIQALKDENSCLRDNVAVAQGRIESLRQQLAGLQQENKTLGNINVERNRRIDELEKQLAERFDPTNHHNAAKCPYCSPQLARAEPQDDGEERVSPEWMFQSLGQKPQRAGAAIWVNSSVNIVSDEAWCGGEQLCSIEYRFQFRRLCEVLGIELRNIPLTSERE